jgi:hypothetical protein
VSVIRQRQEAVIRLPVANSRQTDRGALDAIGVPYAPLRMGIARRCYACNRSFNLG